ncbi:MAG: amino acid permease [Methylibium sp.]|nr:amino acid permease [Methylibium sp.]
MKARESGRLDAVPGREPGGGAGPGGSARGGPRDAEPVATLSVTDAVIVTIGLVIGAGIFKAPSLVAANVDSGALMLGLWLAGGAIALIGALCYAELASTYPSTGGDYHYLKRAFGSGPSFLFAWARMTVMHTGSIALLAYVFGDYASQLWPLGTYSVAIYAVLAVVAFTAINLMGIRQGTGVQHLFTSLEVLGVIAIAVVGLSFATPTPLPVPEPGAAAPTTTLGLAMVFVLLTYGGWNESAYVSGEMRGSRSGISRALVIGIVLITALYLVVNWAYLHVLGLAGMATSEAVAADLMRQALGDRGAVLVSLIVAVSALTSINATMITGARCNYALGRDFPLFGRLGQWHGRANTPVNGLLLQSALVLALVGLGLLARSGFSTMVEYTAPVFWLFFLLSGLALFRLRALDPQRERPFRVPLYPITPLLFCGSSAFMLWSSLSYTGTGALVGVAVLLLGVPVYWLARRPARALPAAAGGAALQSVRERR